MCLGRKEVGGGVSLQGGGRNGSGHWRGGGQRRELQCKARSVYGSAVGWVAIACSLACLLWNYCFSGLVRLPPSGCRFSAASCLSPSLFFPILAPLSHPIAPHPPLLCSVALPRATSLPRRHISPTPGAASRAGPHPAGGARTPPGRPMTMTLIGTWIGHGWLATRQPNNRDSV